MFRLLSWIPGCCGPRYIRYHNEKDSPDIPDLHPTFLHVPPPPARPIPVSHYQRRLIDEDFPQAFRRFSNDANYYQYPMHKEMFEVTHNPRHSASLPPRVPHREVSRRASGGEANFPTRIPTRSPTRAPTRAPTRSPTRAPTRSPTRAPIRSPTRAHDSRAHDSQSQNDPARRRRIADETLAAIERGEVQLQGSSYSFRDVVLHSVDNTQYFPPDSILATWSTSTPASPSTSPAQLELCEGSTLQRARALLQELNSSAAGDNGNPPRVGVLNFASATKPGGGFLSGAQAQEESLARASTLYPSLVTPTATQFYDLHRRDRRDGFYSHAMIFSPSVIVLRDDAGAWVPPHQIEIVTSAAVNAGVVRQRAGEDAGPDTGARIEGVMRERMARILFLFEKQGIRNIVLGSFGTGVFRNDVSMIADIWFDLLAEEGARFIHSFDRVVFGIIDKRTVARFKAVFESRIEAQNSAIWSRETPSGTPRTVLRVVE